MKAIKLALAILPMALAPMASCSVNSWKSDASEIYVAYGDKTACHRESDYSSAGAGMWRAVSISYLEEGSAITVRETSTTAYKVEDGYKITSSESVAYRYANAQWAITYKENL